MIHMANQIGSFFAAYPKNEAVAGIKDHLEKFWEPRMRRQIIEYAAQGAGGLHEYVLEAVKQLAPAPASK